MISILLGIILVVIIIFFVNRYQNKYQSFQGVIFNTIVIAFLLFFLISVFYVYKKNEVSLGSFKGIIDFSKIYFSWILGFFKTIGHVVGYVIKQNWGGSS